MKIDSLIYLLITTVAYSLGAFSMLLIDPEIIEIEVEKVIEKELIVEVKKEITVFREASLCYDLGGVFTILHDDDNKVWELHEHELEYGKIVDFQCRSDGGEPLFWQYNFRDSLRSGEIKTYRNP